MKIPIIETSETALDPTLMEVAKGQEIDATSPFQVSRIGPAPCSRACPAGINVKRYVGLIAEARFEEALAVVRQDNPLAAVCGYLCHRPCEVECAEQAAGTPIPIRALKRMAARIVADVGTVPRVRPVPSRGARVAVIGGGPTGLTAAWALRRKGWGVTIFEATAALGGLLSHSVPEAQLPRWALEADLDFIRAHGMEIRTGASRRGPGALRALFEQGFDAVLIATGAARGLGGSVAGEAAAGASVVPALTMLARLAAGEAVDQRQAVVLGGGSMAVATALGLAAVGVPSVSLLFHRTRGELPADPEDVAALDKAGVILRCGVRAEEIVMTGGVMTGLRVVQTQRGRSRGAGRWTLEGGQGELLPADLLVPAVDRAPDLTWLGGAGGEDAAEGLRITGVGTLAVDAVTLETSVPRVYAAGEVASGPRTVIEAVAMGRRAAAAIHADLSGEPLVAGAPSVGGVRIHEAGDASQQSGWRHLPPVGIGAETPFGSYHEVAEPSAATLEPAALDAARRCQRCGPCEDCRTCSSYCPEALAVTPGGLIVRGPRSLKTSLESITARVDPARCRGCGLCEEHCPYAAPRVGLRPNGRLTALVDGGVCRGCGICVGRCPTGAMSQGHFTNSHLARSVDAVLQPGGDQ